MLPDTAKVVYVCLTVSTRVRVPISPGAEFREWIVPGCDNCAYQADDCTYCEELCHQKESWVSHI